MSYLSQERDRERERERERDLRKHIQFRKYSFENICIKILEVFSKESKMLLKLISKTQQYKIMKQLFQIIASLKLLTLSASADRVKKNSLFP